MSVTDPPRRRPWRAVLGMAGFTVLVTAAIITVFAVLTFVGLLVVQAIVG